MHQRCFVLIYAQQGWFEELMRDPVTVHHGLMAMPAPHTAKRAAEQQAHYLYLQNAVLKRQHANGMLLDYWCKGSCEQYSVQDGNVACSYMATSPLSLT